MPVLEYKCPHCGKKFDELVGKHDEKVLCPVCRTEAERVWSGAMHGATGVQSKHCGGSCGTCPGCGK